jgi:hypothetical protein
VFNNCPTFPVTEKYGFRRFPIHLPPIVFQPFDNDPKQPRNTAMVARIQEDLAIPHVGRKIRSRFLFLMASFQQFPQRSAGFAGRNEGLHVLVNIAASLKRCEPATVMMGLACRERQMARAELTIPCSRSLQFTSSTL